MCNVRSAAETRSHGVFNAVRSASRFLVLPDPNDGPTLGLEFFIGLTVSRNVTFKFRPPPLPVGRRPALVLGTYVPKASVDKDRYARPRENHVWADSETGDDPTVHA